MLLDDPIGLMLVLFTTLVITKVVISVLEFFGVFAPSPAEWPQVARDNLRTAPGATQQNHGGVVHYPMYMARGGCDGNYDGPPPPEAWEGPVYPDDPVYRMFDDTGGSFYMLDDIGESYDMLDDIGDCFDMFD